MSAVRAKAQHFASEDDINRQAYVLLRARHPMTLRQVYYQLVSRQVIPNCYAAYHLVSRALKKARLAGDIPWEWVEDRLRVPRAVRGYSDVGAFMWEVTQRRFALKVWERQPEYVELWCEKDALSGMFADVMSTYRITLNVGRGYDGWSSVHDAAERFKWTGKPCTILYFGGL
jgi:hypothetical protein